MFARDATCRKAGDLIFGHDNPASIADVVRGQWHLFLKRHMGAIKVDDPSGKAKFDLVSP
jgi:hypothetical protein